MGTPKNCSSRGEADIVKAVNRALQLARGALRPGGTSSSTADDSCEKLPCMAFMQLDSAAEELQKVAPPLRSSTSELAGAYPQLRVAVSGAAEAWKAAAKRGLSAGSSAGTGSDEDWVWPQEVHLAFAALDHIARKIGAERSTSEWSPGEEKTVPASAVNIRRPAPVLQCKAAVD